MIPDAVRVPGGVPAPPHRLLSVARESRTFALDARILARTAGVVLRGDGAY